MQDNLGLCKKLQQLLRKDKVPTTINAISEFGLIEMTRKRTRASLGRQLNETCFYCDGTGHIQSRETVAREILREVHREYRWMPGYEIVIHAHAAVVDVLNTELKDALQEAENRFTRRIRLISHRNDFHLEQFHLEGPDK
jgi:ribonuclease G